MKEKKEKLFQKNFSKTLDKSMKMCYNTDTKGKEIKVMTNKFEKVRKSIMDSVSEQLALKNYEVLTTGSQEICVPIVNDEGDEGYLVVVFKIPKGSRDGDEYNGYEVAKEYADKLAEKERKKAEREAKSKARSAKVKQNGE
jgi:hypothetical protein